MLLMRLQVNDIVNRINDILKSAAKTVGCMKDNYRPKLNGKSIDKKAIGKPWFNQACKERRKHYFQAKAVLLCTVKIKLMLIEMPNIMQVGTIKRKLTSNINYILRILRINKKI